MTRSRPLLPPAIHLRPAGQVAVPADPSPWVPLVVVVGGFALYELAKHGLHRYGRS